MDENNYNNYNNNNKRKFFYYGLLNITYILGVLYFIVRDFY